jgi:hypothetical protein
MNNQFEIIVELTFKEYVRANYQLFLKKGKIIVLFGIVIMFFMTDSLEYSTKTISGALFVAVMFLSPYLNSKRAWAMKPQYAERTTYLLSDTSLRVSSLSMNAEYTWNNFLRFEVLKNYYYLFLSDQQLMIFPFSSFTSQAQIELFREFVAAKINPKNAALQKSVAKKSFFIVAAVWIAIMCMVFMYMFLKR